MNTPLTVVFIGHVDHGKSTLIARLLLDAGAFPEGRLAELEAASSRRGHALELSFLLDALQIERDQSVTVDASHIWLNADGRTIRIIDAPGHREFIKHVVTGASEAAACVVLVDASEGVCEQTRRHVLLMALLGVRDAILVVNKMDMRGFDQTVFNAIVQEVDDLLQRSKIACRGAIPAVARDGDNVVTRSGRMNWYEGPTLFRLLRDFEVQQEARSRRFIVQDVYRRDGSRIVAGLVQGEGATEEQEWTFFPRGERARVKRFERFPQDTRAPRDGEAVGMTLDRPIFVEPGDVGFAGGDAPHLATEFDATIFWLSKSAVGLESKVRIRVGARDVDARVVAVHGRIEPQTLAIENVAAVSEYEIALVRLRLEAAAPVDMASGSILSRFAIYRDGAVCGGGAITKVIVETAARVRSPNVEAEGHLVTIEARRSRFGHRSGVVWFTGLPGSGKSTIARGLEQILFARGWNVFALDGDTLRTTLNGDLGFSTEDRRENVRRVGEVGALFAAAGAIAIVCLVSPFEEDRARARSACTEGTFVEIFLNTPLAVCELRDPKGLYKRARAGEIADFTGVSSPYEVPARPDLSIDASAETIEASVKRAADLVIDRFRVSD